MHIRNYTPLPVSKWTASSLLKHNDEMWSKFLKKMLESDLSREEKNRRIDRLLPFVKQIHEQCENKEITFKKLI